LVGKVYDYIGETVGKVYDFIGEMVGKVYISIDKSVGKCSGICYDGVGKVQDRSGRRSGAVSTDGDAVWRQGE
jgi:rRNA processing protein Gar1